MKKSDWSYLAFRRIILTAIYKMTQKRKWDFNSVSRVYVDFWRFQPEGTNELTSFGENSIDKIDISFGYGIKIILFRESWLCNIVLFLLLQLMETELVLLSQEQSSRKYRDYKLCKFGTTRILNDSMIQRKLWTHDRCSWSFYNSHLYNWLHDLRDYMGLNLWIQELITAPTPKASSWNEGLYFK